MKFSNQPAVAAGLALVSVAAHAQLPPAAQNTSTYPATTGLYLAVYDSAGTNTELVNLGYDQAQTQLATGNLNPSTPNSAFAVAAAPTGGGQVLQLNFGIISGFTAAGGNLFTSANASTTEFLVLAQTCCGPGVQQYQTTAPSSFSISYTGTNTIVSNIAAEVTDWATYGTVPPLGDVKDTTGTATYSLQASGAPLQGGSPLPGGSFGVGLNTAAEYFNITTSSARKTTISPYSNGVGNGYWYLSNTGDLTYDIPYAASAVPLPPALWLLGSGLLGLAGISRRRVAAA